MASTLIRSKSNSGKSSNSGTTTNEIPITEEELMKKETPINVNDVLRLRKPTKGRNQEVRKICIYRFICRIFNGN